MTLRVFFVDYCEGKRVDSKDAWEATLEDILHEMDCVLHYPRNFIGVIDGNDVTIQFMVNKDKTILVDVPVPEEGGSYGKTTDLRECLNLVRKIGDRIQLEEIDGLTFERW